MKRIILTSATAALVASGTGASAHGGHVAEVAGHAHWIGIGLVVGAAALAGAVVYASRKKRSCEDESHQEIKGETQHGDEQPEAV
ncbi:DUF6732 family protein [Flexibacterium corallicola]|uniref:DUF6732 family protein n=1 Tax=Flexibacterium corallicola TaxID=3037259 RepID=UPI00286F4DB6|nr:DUF6732 family protein [Pseudovibrio sp. M1P-2-3]